MIGTTTSSRECDDYATPGDLAFPLGPSRDTASAALLAWIPPVAGLMILALAVAGLESLGQAFDNVGFFRVVGEEDVECLNRCVLLHLATIRGQPSTSCGSPTTHARFADHGCSWSMLRPESDGPFRHRRPCPRGPSSLDPGILAARQ